MKENLRVLLRKIQDGVRAVLPRAGVADAPEWIQFARICFGEESAEEPDDIREIQRRARQGDAEAQCALGAACASGEGLPQDIGEAKKWLTRATARGHEEAKEIVGVIRGRNASVLSDGNAAFEFGLSASAGVTYSVWIPKHPAGIVYIAMQVSPDQDRGKSYFGSTHITHAQMKPSGRNLSPQRKALRRRKAQHYLAAEQGGQLSPFREALACPGTEFLWDVAMVVFPPSAGGEGGSVDWRWCAEAAEAWHIHHFGTIPNGYNAEIPAAYRALVETDQGSVFCGNGQYKGCLFCVNDRHDAHPGKIAERVGHFGPKGRNDRSWTKSFFPQSMELQEMDSAEESEDA